MIYPLISLCHLWLLMFHLLLRLLILNRLCHLLYLIFGRLFIQNYSWCLLRFRFFLEYFLLPLHPLWFWDYWCNFLLLDITFVVVKISFSWDWFPCGSSSYCMIGSRWKSPISFLGIHFKWGWLLSRTGCFSFLASCSTISITSWYIGYSSQMYLCGIFPE